MTTTTTTTTIPKSIGIKPMHSVSDIQYLPIPLLLLVHLYILEYPHAKNPEYDHNIFNSRKRGLRERTQTMEDIAYFLVAKIEIKGAKMVLSSYPCLQPSESLAFRTSLAKYLENIRHQAIYRNPKSSEGDAASWWRDVVVRKSLLEECSGDKFERLMLSLSTHALMSMSRPLSPDSMRALLRDEPVAYATALATCQAMRHNWTKMASLISRSALDLNALQERLLSVPSSKYSTLSTARLQALAEAGMEDLLQRYWAGPDGKEALLSLLELAGLKSNPKQPLQVEPISVTAVIPTPLPIAAAHHPVHMKCLRRPIFQDKLRSSPSSPSHSEIILSGHIDSLKRVHQTLAAALARTKNSSVVLSEKFEALRPALGSATSKLGFWTHHSEEIFAIDFYPEAKKELVTSSGLDFDWDSFDPDGVNQDSLEKKIDAIRASILPAYPLMPDLSLPPLAPRDLLKQRKAPISAKPNSKIPQTMPLSKPDNPSKKSTTEMSTPVGASTLQVPPLDTTQTPAMSPSKSSHSIRRKSARFSMARRRAGRSSMFRAFSGELVDEIDKLVDETHDFPTDDEDTENEHIFPSQIKTPKPKKPTVNRIWTAGTPVSMSAARKDTHKLRMSSGLTRRLDMEPTLSMPSLASWTSSISSDPFDESVGGGGAAQSDDGEGECRTKDADATPGPIMRDLPRPTSCSTSLSEQEIDDQGYSDSDDAHNDEGDDWFGDDPPSMTLKEILLSSDTSHFDLLDGLSEDMEEGMLVEDASFVWE